MSPDPTVSPADVITLATEHWRLGAWLATVRSGSTTLAQRSLRQIGDVLARIGVEAQSLDGRPFDAGLNAVVVDTVDDPGTPTGQSVVDETVSPLILRNGQVVRAAEIVVRRGTRPF